MSSPSVPKPPNELIQATSAGQCVAFVGAGFSAACVPPWRDLLLTLASEASPEAEKECRSLLTEGPLRALDLEAAAQTLREAMSEQGFVKALRALLAQPEPKPPMDERLARLREIPFRAVLTTNFDGLLEGPTPGPKAYAQVLRGQGHRWWDRRYWDGLRPGPQVVKLHGDLDPPADLVIARRDYRERLYQTPGYLTFLRSVFSTTTVLYLGFSFTDAYLNELRSEILALLEHREDDAPVAYALINDVSPQLVAHFRKHEGIEILTYSTEGGDFSGFDRWLGALHEATSPARRLGRLLEGRRLLWLDAQPRHNDFGKAFLQEAAAAGDRGSCEIQEARTWTEALDALGNGADLIVTHWGHDKATDTQGRPCSVAERLLMEVRSRDLRVAVIIFAGGDHADENRQKAIRLGALAYCYEWASLFREIERVFAPIAPGRGD